MFEKLLANLPYNPKLTDQIAFYARRMRREQSIRRTGLIFIVLAFMVQFFAFISPPQTTSAYSTSDMIDGGFTSQAQAVAACRENVKQYQRVLADFGVSCDAVARAHTVSLVPTQNDNQLFSMGWLSYGTNNPVTGKPTDQTAYNLPGVSGTVYAQRHSSFYGGGNEYKQYPALQGVNSEGRTFWLLYGCGNLVFIGVPQPEQPCKYDSNLLANDSRCVAPCAYNRSIPANSPQCFPPCPIPGKSNLPKTSPLCVAPCPYNKALPANSPKCFPPCKYNASLPATSPQCFPPCQYNSSIPATSHLCVPCTAALSSSNAYACIIESKTAANTTQGVSDANNTTAQPGDTIVYTLHAKNSGKATISKFVMQENLSDVLVYADVTNRGGGSLDSSGEIRWPAVDIKPGQTETHQVTVKVKSTIPVQAPTADDPNHFDHIMTNVYGTTVNINVPTPLTPVTPIVTVSQKLPNTGPGSSLAIAAVVVVIAGYFFARSRLLVNESVIAIQEKNSGRL